ncbi:MAG: M60 family metallopeptidase, partial [Phycisphaerales bacterium]
AHALRILAGDESGDVVLAARVVREALAIVPLHSPLIKRADELATTHSETLREAYAAMGDRPLRLADQPLACALLDLVARRASTGEVRAHPSAAAFPGPVPADLPRISRELHFERIPGWRSTGLYAAPGEAVTVRLIEGDVTGVVIQIGAWLDPQQFDDRVRMPVAVYRSPLDGGGSAASPIGGPIYLDMPAEVAQQGITVEIIGAVEMPRYRHGETDLDEWRSRLRHLPIQWAELESDEMVFTIPADAIRDLDRPDLVMEHWKRIHEVMQGMEPRSPRHWPDRQLRYVAEKRLSWGYMYCPSDAPLVIPMTEARPMVEIANFDAEGPNRLWGHYHEMGHTHQNPMWTFEGTGEVTVNIFTVLALNIINGYPLDSEVMRSEPGRAWATFVQHRQAGAPFDRWKSDPFLALQTYALLWHAFGWDAFRETFRAYDHLPPGDRPRTDAEKRDLFVITFSRTVGRNLAPYFKAWGIPLTPRVDAVLADLPLWDFEAE